MSSNNISIHWFRQDLRLEDNQALFNACQQGLVLPIYILDDVNSGMFRIGEASRVWLHNSLQSLNKSLNGKLSVYIGNPLEVLLSLSQKYNISNIYWNRCYEPWQINRDTKIKKILIEQGLAVNTYNSLLLWEPWEVLKSDGTPYKVFTPYYRNGCLNSKIPRFPLPIPTNLSFINDIENQLNIDNLNLLPNIPWDKELVKQYKIGEKGAKLKLNDFIAERLSSYKDGRNYPEKPNISRLSPHLHFGEISPNNIWHKVRSHGDNDNIDTFCSELGWREFSYNLLYHNPNLPTDNFQSKFDKFPWSIDKEILSKWQKGQTGIPIVDAGMRELWQTGFMHNRVRMIVGSFLVKNLMLDWREGERWFFNCLFDADLASNSASWQWIAGCGADAAPYYRIFNPVLQGQKFDINGKYTRHYVPELVLLPDKYLFNPWEAPQEILKVANLKLGENYPHPIVDLKKSRDLALAAFKSLEIK